MVEDQHDNKPWQGSAKVVTLILLTLALNASIREEAALIEEVDDVSSNIRLILLTTIVFGQIISAAALIGVESPHNDWPDKEALIIILLSHAGTIFLHDYLIHTSNGSFFIAAAYFGPLLALITLLFVSSVCAQARVWLSLTFISIGCVSACTKSASIIQLDHAALTLVLATLCSILRNLVVRQLVTVENVSVQIRSKKVVLGMISLASVFLLIMQVFLSPVWVAASLYSIITCMLSVFWTYVTVQVLKSYTVSSVAVFNVWALLIEALILTPREYMPDFTTMVLAMVLLMFGHLLFVKHHLEQTTGGNLSGLSLEYSSKPASIHEQYTRIQFLLFAVLAIGVVTFVFQPQVSDRDLLALGYVGLDKVVRRLLSHQVPDEAQVPSI